MRDIAAPRAPRRRPRLSEAIATYLLALRAERRRDQTIAHYRTRLLRLRALVGDRPLASISAGMLRRALLAVKAERRDGRPRPISDRYVYQHHAVWRAFFNWCRRDGRMRRASPMAALRAPHVDEAELAVFSRADVRALLGTQDPRTFEGARDRVIMLTLYDTGLRVGELVRLDAAAVDLEARVLHVERTKGRRARRVPLSPRLARIIRGYLTRWRRPALFPSLAPAALFTSRRGAPLTENGVRQWMRDAGRAADIAARCSPHTWRHTFATAFLLNGGSERALMLIMGITSRGVIDRYVHLVATHFAARAHRLASPLARL